MAADIMTIKDFIDCWFNENYKIFTKEQFDEAYAEYIDTTGMFATDEFEKVVYIHYLNQRINSVNLSIKLHRDFYVQFGKPFITELKFFSRYGHKLTWRDDWDDFDNQLVKIENSEKKYVTILNKNVQELEAIRTNKGANKPQTKKEIRTNFLRMLNSLGKIGYKIDKTNTTVEELALMIKQQFEEQEQYSK